MSAAKPQIEMVASTGSREGQTAAPTVYWRAEGSLVDLTAVRPVAYFSWNAQSFAERWARRGGLAITAVLRPFIYLVSPRFATRVLHTSLRRVTRDRLDLLGEEYFNYILKKQLKPEGVAKLKECLTSGARVVLVSQGLDQLMKPMAEYLGVKEILANRLEFRDGVATGRLLDPIVPPRGLFAMILGGAPDGTIAREKLAKTLGVAGISEPAQTVRDAKALPIESVPSGAIEQSSRASSNGLRSVVLSEFSRNGSNGAAKPFSVHKALAGKHILLVGVTGFIGKVWLVQLLTDVPEIARIYLLIRRQKSNTAARRFEKILQESPVFAPLHEKLGAEFERFINARVEVVEGDLEHSDLGLDAETRKRLEARLDLVVNSSGLTDFNPDLREALSSNVAAPMHCLEFVRGCDNAALMHLSTCFVVGGRDGRVHERFDANYTPANAEFDAEREWKSLEETIRKVEERAESPEMTAALKRQALGRRGDPAEFSEKEVENVLRRNRQRWVRNRLTQVGMKRAKRLGWPNTYTLTKSMAESLISTRGADLPVALVRPSIVETSTRTPFSGWNEGINTSAPLSYLLGTYFRQLPTNRRKCLDIIPVDMVCRGMTLIAAALVERRNHRVYQLATSAVNPCNMGRSIELTGLAHRKHYKAQQGLEHWLKLRFDTIPVSKGRYQKLSVPAQKAFISGINRIAAKFQFKPPMARAERDLGRIEKLIELYEPFILHNEQVFEADHAQLLSESLPENERAQFGYDPDSIDWWDYWINIHVPALRKWCYPLIEGRSLEAQPKRSVQLAAISGRDADAEASEPADTGAAQPD
ncbi:MAG TPA: SDR family oxidoreductase [Candidatus Acidoferrales bacterium]|nr:SDR family oxidoreductase [Candidatus Acidoferrales bacterium]